MARVVLIGVIMLLSTRSALANSLQPNFVATSYGVTLTVGDLTNLQTAAVTGTVAFTLTCTTTTTSVQFHYGSSLTPTSLQTTDIRSFTVTSGTTSTGVTVSSVSMSADDSIVTLTTSGNINSGDVVTFTVGFTAAINRQMKGLFYRQFTNAQGSPSTILMTNLKPFYARELFPCLDEPGYPAAITITLTRPSSSWTAVSTLPKTSSGNVDTFTSSTNLPPDALGLFLYTNDMVRLDYQAIQSATRLTYFARSSYTGYVLNENTAFLANYYYQAEGLMGQLHPLGTLNIVLVPNLPTPVAAYGFIFIREDTYAGDYSSAQTEGLFRMKIMPVLYEFLRQFTEFSTRPRLWSDTWMTDAFTKYLQYTLLYSIGSPFDFKTDFAVVLRQTALALDTSSSPSVQDTSLDTATSTAALEYGLSDPLRSLKGAVLLSMMDLAFPAGVVYRSILRFLSTNQQVVVTSSNFYNSLKTAITGSGAYLSADANTAITNLDSWFTTAGGYCIINLGTPSLGTPGSISLTLGKFCDVMPCSTTSTLPSYSVAVTIGSKTAPRYYIVRQDIWATGTTNPTATLFLTAGDWVVVNLQSSGYYRAAYTSDDWTAIIRAVTSGSGEIASLSQVVDDAFANALATGQATDFNTTLQLAVATLRTPSFANWYPVAMGLSRIKDKLLGTSQYVSYQNFMRPFLRTVDTMLNNGSLNIYHRAKVFTLFLDAMCEFDIPGYRSTAASNISTLLDGVLPTRVPSSSYDSLVCCAAQNNLSLNPQTLWNNIIDTSSTSSYYKKHYNAIALGCYGNITRTTELFTTMLTTDVSQIRPHLETVFTYLADKYPSQLAASLPANAVNLQTRLGAAAVAAIVVRAGSRINNNTQAAILSSLSTVSNLNQIVRTVATSTVNAVSTRVTWLSTNGANLGRALDGYRPSGGSATSGATTTVVCFLILMVPIAQSVLTIR